MSSRPLAVCWSPYFLVVPSRCRFQSLQNPSRCIFRSGTVKLPLPSFSRNGLLRQYIGIFVSTIPVANSEGVLFAGKACKWSSGRSTQAFIFCNRRLPPIRVSYRPGEPHHTYPEAISLAYHALGYISPAPAPSLLRPVVSQPHGGLGRVTGNWQYTVGSQLICGRG